MTERKKWISLVAKLLEATQTNTITWNFSDPPDTIRQSGERTDQVYEASFMGKIFRLYPYRFKFFSNEERFEWSDGIKLEFIDPIGRSLFEVPNVEGINQLLEAVKYQTADIDQFLQTLAT